MAYGIKWFSEFKDNEAGISGVEIYERDYSGESIEVKSGDTPITIDIPQVDNPYQVIRSAKAVIQWISEPGVDFDIADLFITDAKKYQARFYRYDENDEKEYLWYGYLVFVNCEAPFQPRSYYVTFSASCGLPFTRDEYFLDDYGRFVEGKMSLIKVIAQCLKKSGFELDIHTYVNLYEQGMTYGTTSPLALAEVDSVGFRGLKCADVLEQILAPFGAMVVQSRGVWVIKRVKDQLTFNSPLRKFNANGVDTGYSLVGQCSSIGLEPYDEYTPNVIALDGAIMSFAEPNSIITNDFTPGLAVNRLVNGLFSGNYVGTAPPGWLLNVPNLKSTTNQPVGFSREGFGTPDDPFRYEIRGYIYFTAMVNSSARGDIINNYLDAIPDVEVRPGPWADQKTRDNYKMKVVISGKYRIRDAQGFTIRVRLNEDHRNKLAFLDNNGKWTDTDKLGSSTGFLFENTDSFPENMGKSFDDIPLSTFSITSDYIKNWDQDGDQARATIRMTINPAEFTVGTNVNSKFPNARPLLAIEDLSITILTETIYEGDHSYEIDGRLPIRNANSVSIKTGIGDKINITTAEQSRAANRVMTGYMTRAGGSTPTTGWRSYKNGVADATESYEPMQKRILTEMLRQLCGKRRVLQGNFKGYGVWPDHAIFSRYDEEGSPTKFFTVTAWKWDVKRMRYDLTINELDFTPLAYELVTLKDGNGNSADRRTYTGGAASGSNTSSSNPSGDNLPNTDVDYGYYGDDDTSVQVLVSQKGIVQSIENKPIPLPHKTVVAGEALVPGQYVYLKWNEITEVWEAFLALANDKETLAQGFVYKKIVEKVLPDPENPEDPGEEPDPEPDPIVLGDEIQVKFSSNLNPFMTGLIPGEHYYLLDNNDPETVEDYPWLISAVPPTEPGHYVQRMGYAVSETELMVEMDQPKKLWTPPFVNVPEMRFVVGSEITAELQLNDYLADYTDDSAEYSYRLLQLPHWVTAKSVVFNNIEITGTADLPGTYEFLLEIKNKADDLFNLPIYIIVEEKPVVEVTLIDTDTSTVVGSIPDTSLVSLVMPDNWNNSIHIIGTHNRVWAKVTLPDGSTYQWTTPYVEVTLTPEATYPLFIAPVSYGPGLVKLEFKAWYGETIIHDSTRQYFLTDPDEITTDLTVALWDINADPAVEIAEINPTGVTTIIKPLEWDLKVTIENTEHDNVTMKLVYSGGEIDKSFDQDPAVEDAVYAFFEGIDAGLEAGDYTLLVIVNLLGDPVLSNAFPLKLIENTLADSFAINIGDGVNTEFTITHNLGTTELISELVRNIDGAIVGTTTKYPTENTAYLRFKQAPTFNQFKWKAKK